MHYIKDGYYLTVQEIAERYGLNVSGVRRTCQDNRIPNVKLGKSGYIVRLEACEKHWGERHNGGQVD